jgi:homoserine kinase type II
MAQYTRLLENDIQGIAGKYELEVIGYKPIEQGANSTYLINTTEGKHVLTVFECEPIRIAHMSKVLLLLEKYDFPAPRLKVMSSGKVLAKYQENPVLIKPYIPGQVLEDLDEGQVGQVGAALATLHEIPAPDYLPSKHTYVEETYPQIMEQEIDPGYKKWVEQRHRRVVENIPQQLPVGIVHGDLFSENVLFDDQKFKAIIDFEDVSRIWKVFDLGMAVVGICTDDTEIVIKKVRALVKGYQEIRLLEETEIECLQKFIEWAAVLTSTWRFWKSKIDLPNIDKSRNHMQMVNIAKNVSAIPKEEFYNAIFVAGINSI